MIALLISALLVSPLTPQKLWEREILCWPDTGYCAPRVVNLGEIDVRPPDRDWPVMTYPPPPYSPPPLP